MVLLILVNALIFTGVGQYQGRNGQRQSLMLTANKWFYRRDLRLPFTFSEMKLTGQYVSGALASIMLVATAILQLIHVCKFKHSKLMVGFLKPAICHSLSINQITILVHMLFIWVCSLFVVSIRTRNALLCMSMAGRLLSK